MRLFNKHKTQILRQKSKSKKLHGITNKLLQLLPIPGRVYKYHRRTDEIGKYSGSKIFHNEDSISDYGNSTTMQSETNEMI